MRIIAVILLLFAIPLSAYQAQPTGRKDGGANNAAKTAAQTKQELGNPSQAPLNNSANTVPPKQPSQDVASDPPSDPPGWRETLNAVSTAIIAVFTILLFIGVWRQICTSRAIERAWVMAEIQPDPEKPRNGRLQVFEGSGTEGESTAAMNAVLNCSNAGKTPAWIEETIAKFEMAKTLPDTPNFESAQPIQRSTIPLGMAEGGAVPYSQNIPWMPIAERHQSIDEMAVIYGRVIYRDIFGKRRTTTFGYKIRPHGRLERLDGYPEYNKST